MRGNMRHLKFHLAKAVNILCFGPQGVEFHFSDYGDLVHVQGVNLDMPGTDDHPASNGAGKSSIQEILSIGLFGRQVKNTKKLTGSDIINVLSDSGSVEVQWDDYRVVRTYKRAKTGAVTCKIDIWESPDRIWDDESKVSKGACNQEWIDDKIRLSHHAFCNVLIFDDSDEYAFLKADTPKKREFVENLLGLDQYKLYHENAKAYLRDQRKLIERLSLEYQRFKTDVEVCDKRIASVQQQENQWRQNKQQEMVALVAQIKAKQKELESTSTGEQMSKWENAQEKIVANKAKIEGEEAKRAKTAEAIESAKVRLDNLRSEKQTVELSLHDKNLGLKSVQQELKKTLELLTQLGSLEEGTRCPTCHGVVSRDNYGNVLLHSQNIADGCRSKIEQQSKEIEVARGDLNERGGFIANLESKIQAAEAGLKKLDASINALRRESQELARIPKPEGNAIEIILENKILELKKQLASKKTEFEGESPYKEIIQQAKEEKTGKEQDVLRKSQEIKDAERLIPYYEYWVQAFGDRGIRKYVVDGIIPALNTRLAYWMGYLTDGIIQVEFDNELEVKILRKGNPVKYFSASKGETRKINLAVSQGFAYVMMLNSGVCPSIIFLDEITGGGIDRASTTGVYNTISEIAKERQVFVTTHNENLISMLQGCQTVRLQKKDDVTVLLA